MNNMNNLNCLETLTEDIVRKQNDSLESIYLLCRTTDKISSDISNLINSLQMVGNRQFAENRVQDDDSVNCGNILSGHHQQQHKDISTTGPQVPVSSAENNKLKLSSILLKAIDLMPINNLNEDTPSSNEEEVEVEEGKKEVEVEEKSKEEDENENEDEIKEEFKDLGKVEFSEVHVAKEVAKEREVDKVDRDRVTDLLKRYSLYDDDDDDDDDESE